MKNIQEVIVPKLGPNDLTVTIIEWNVKEDDFINKGHLICTIETSKLTFDIESDCNGNFGDIPGTFIWIPSAIIILSVGFY